MPRYFFVVDDASDSADVEAETFADDAAAGRAAVKIFGEILRFEERFLDSGAFGMVLEDETRQAILELMATARRA